MTHLSSNARRRESESSSNRHEFLDQLTANFEFTPPTTPVRTMLPVLVICGGGAGAGIGRRLKWNLNRNGVQAHARFLVLDTDETSQASEGEYPGFDESEFCHLSIERVRDVLHDPRSHKLLAERLNLDDETIRRQLLSIIDRGLDQAGQVRPIGLVAFWANMPLIKQKLERQLAELRGLYSQLEQQLAMSDNVRLRPRLQVIITGSLAGGTNSSFCVDLAAYIRHLVSNHNIEITGCFLLPNVLDEKLAGKLEEWVRVRANAYDAIRAIDAFDDGFGTTHDVQFGGNEREMFAAPSTLYNQIHLVERFTADGRDLRSLEAVQDLVALHLAGDIGSAIGDQLDVTDANDVTRQNLAPDPATGRARRFSTIGAAALGIPVKSMFRYCVARQLIDVCDMMLSEEGKDKTVNAAVTGCVHENQFGNVGQPLSTTYRTAVVPNSDVYVNSLFQRVTPNGRQYYGNAEFPSRLQAARQQFRDNHQPKITKHLNELTEVTTVTCEKDFKRRVYELIQTRGLRSAYEFVVKVEGELDRIEQGLAGESTKALTLAVESDKRARADAERLKGFFKKLFTDRATQERVAMHYRQCIAAAIDTEVKRAVMVVVQRVRARCGRQMDRLTGSIDDLVRLRSDAEKLYLGNLPNGHRVTTMSLSEVDISTPEMFDEFYRTNSCNSARLMESAAGACGVSPAVARQSLGLHGDVFNHVIRDMSTHFSKRISVITVAEQLEQQLAPKSKSRSAARLKLREAVRACQPMWKAEPGRLDVAFGDSIALGVPANVTNETRENLATALKEAAAALNSNPRYMAEANIVSISDPHRVIALRRSHGGRPHYLNCWEEIKRAYESWVRDGGHPVHTFSREHVANMPTVEPRVEASQGEEAFALALACGWIARRGPYYYWNLQQDGSNGTTKRTVRLMSEWDGLAFIGAQAHRSNALETFVRCGRMLYLDRTDGESQYLLASGLDNARRVFLADREKIDVIHSAFSDLRAAAGDQNVLREMSDYVGSLPQRVKAGDTHYELVMKQVPVLSQLITKLNRGI